VSFVRREFPDIVRDVLTTLTQGVAGEVHRVDYDPTAAPLPAVVLRRRPVRRVSVVSGFVAAPKAGDPPVPHTFSLNDYELAATGNEPDDLSTVRFLPFGKRPAPGTDVSVNYYPRSADPAPVNDLNVGSVVRTLMEAVSKELAVLYAQLNLAYDSAYVETAGGVSLDRVVALLGYRRFQAGRAVGTVTFTRRAGSPGSITIPAGTPVTDKADQIHYETSETREMLAGEATAEVRVRGEGDAVPPVEAGVLRVIQRAIAGLDTVVNGRPTTRAGDDETDQELRAQARSALLGSSNGTLESLTHGLLQMPEVRDVKVTEMPNGVPGEIRVAVSLAEPPADPSKLPPSVLERIESLRAAGIRVISVPAGSVNLQAKVKLVLAGSFFPPPVVEQVRAGARAALLGEVKKKGVGEKIRARPLAAAILADARIVDVAVTLVEKGTPPIAPGADCEIPEGATAHLDPSDIAFESESYDKPPPSTGRSVPVEVRASLAATLLAGVSPDDAKGVLTSRLKQFFAAMAPGATIDAPSLLNALRDDTRYAIDPLKLKVTLTSDAQFVQVVQGGAAFTVLSGHAFTVAAVEVSP